MDPRFVDLPQKNLVGIVGCGTDVGGLDIHALWERFHRHEKDIPHRVEGKGYELHGQTDTLPAMHFCMVGVEVAGSGTFPSSCSPK